MASERIPCMRCGGSGDGERAWQQILPGVYRPEVPPCPDCGGTGELDADWHALYLQRSQFGECDTCHDRTYCAIDEAGVATCNACYHQMHQIPAPADNTPAPF